MLNGISPYGGYAAYGAAYASRAALTQGPDKAQAAQRSAPLWGAQKAAQPEAPVQPVDPVRPVDSLEDPAQQAMLRYRSDPAELAVRMRIQTPGEAAQNPALSKAEAAGEQQAPALENAQSPQEVMEEGECQTCKERKYQDGSDDPGVSFKTPTNISPDQAASAVRGHENEHVVREQAKARQEDRKVVSQSVTYHTAICPECGKAYVSGGTTRTVTKADNSAQAELQQEQKQAQQQNTRVPFSAVA